MPPPPPVTPSPHRFLPPSEPRTAKPASALQHNHSTIFLQTPNRQPSHTSQLAPISSSQKPAPARRFAFPSSPPTQNRERAETPHIEPPWIQTSRPPRKLHRVESIEDASQGTDDGDIQDSTRGDWITQSIELTPSAKDNQTEILFAPSNHKRRRLSHSPPSVYTDNSLSLTPQLPAAPVLPSHRFLPPRTPASSSVTSSANLPAETSTRPTFLLPSHTSASSPTRPLPDTFSPQRRGQKFVQGGLANTVRSWVIDVAHTASHPSTGIAHSDGWRIRIRVTEVRPPADSSQDSDGLRRGGTAETGNTMILVRGILDPLSRNASNTQCGAMEVRAMLAGHGTQRGARPQVSNGSVVGIRPPCWDVELSGEKWVVAADWGVL